MKTYSIADMVKMGVDREEAIAAMELFQMLKPALHIKENGRIDTTGGDKTPLGLYRTLKRFFEPEAR